MFAVSVGETCLNKNEGNYEIRGTRDDAFCRSQSQLGFIEVNTNESRW